ncbi:MAG: ELM1/GtrOC1 family putative glycosyltransferase [Pseudomonadota bacterium]
MIHDGVPGHEARSRGVLAALAQLGPVDPVWVPGALRGKLARALMIGCAAIGSLPLRLTLWAHAARLPGGWPDVARPGRGRPDGGRPDEARPDLVIGAGGRTQFLTLALALQFGVPSVFAGLPRHLDGQRFSAVIAPYPVPGLPNLIELEMPLSEVNPEAATRAGAVLRAEAGAAPVWTVLVGGDGGGYRYGEAEWAAMAGWLAAQAAAAGARLCLATSRRTGRAAEARLRTKLPASGFLARKIWGEGARGGLLPLMGAADLIITTADSATMIGEAVATGRPVLVLEPASSRPAPRHLQVLSGLAARGRIGRLALAELPETIATAHLRPIAQSPLDVLAEALAPVVGQSVAARAEPPLPETGAM